MTAAAKYKPPVDTTPFYDVHIVNAEKVVREIAESRIPVGAIKIDLGFLRGWVRDSLKTCDTPAFRAWLEEAGLKVERRPKP